MGPLTHLLRHVASGRPIAFSNSPLAKPKSQAEVEYEAAQLAALRPFRPAFDIRSGI